MNILFLCTSNVFRSQMAEAFFNYYNKNTNNHVKSAALVSHQEKMHTLVIRAMKEKGICIEKCISKKVTPKIIEESNLMILMNPKLKPLLEQIASNKRIELWGVEDVVAAETDEHRYPEFVKARNYIETKIRELIKRLD